MLIRSTLVFANILGLAWFAASMCPQPTTSIQPRYDQAPRAETWIDWSEHRTHCRTMYMERFGPGFTAERSAEHLFNYKGIGFSSCQAAAASSQPFSWQSSQLQSCVFRYIPTGPGFCNLDIREPKQLAHVRRVTTERDQLRLEGVVSVGAIYKVPLVFEFREEGDDLVFTGMGATRALRYIASGKEFDAAHITWHTDANEVELQGTLLYKHPFPGAEMDGAGHIDFYFSALRK